MNEIKYRFFIVFVNVVTVEASFTFTHGHRSQFYANQNNIVKEVTEMINKQSELKVLGISINSMIECSNKEFDHFFALPPAQKIIIPKPEIIQS